MKSSDLKTFPLVAGGVALLWWLVFQFNDWLAQGFQIGEFVYWLFLPAAVRVLAVLQFGWRGVVGLFMGSVWANSGLPAGDALESLLVLAAISSLTPMLASEVVRRSQGITNLLEGFTQAHLIRMMFLTAVLNAGLHQVWFAWTGAHAVWLTHLVAMVVGDVLGCLVVMYGLSLAIDLFDRIKGPPPA
jgi:hypothetical protein